MTSVTFDDRSQNAAWTVCPRSLSELLSLPPDTLTHCDVARMNLLCAEGLPGAENLDIDQCLATLDQWTVAVRRYTAGALPRFRCDPLADSGDGHEGVFRFVAMTTLLKHPRGLGVSYQPTAIGNFDFWDSRDDLLHGILARRLGTCASLPVLFIAIGRRLGYPMHLALAKRHFLCQWVNDDGSRRNLEGSGSGGGDSRTDAFYIHAPKGLTTDELATGRYLRPLASNENLAAFLEIRGHCLKDNLRFDEARQAYVQARRFAPKWVQPNSHFYQLQERRPLSQFAIASSTRNFSNLTTVHTNDLHYP